MKETRRQSGTSGSLPEYRPLYPVRQAAPYRTARQRTRPASGRPAFYLNEDGRRWA